MVEGCALTGSKSTAHLIVDNVRAWKQRNHLDKSDAKNIHEPVSCVQLVIYVGFLASDALCYSQCTNVMRRSG
jgi:hypothetical protein